MTNYRDHITLFELTVDPKVLWAEAKFPHLKPRK